MTDETTNSRIASSRGTPGPEPFWARVWSLARPWRGRLIVVAGCVIGAAFTNVIPPLVVRHVINANLVPRHSAGLVTSGLAYLGAVAVGAVFVYAYSYLAAIVAQRIIVTLRADLFSHISMLPIAYLDRTPVGDTISRATADVETIDTLFTDGLTTLVGQAVSIVAIAIAMIIVSPLLTLVSFVVLPPLVIASRWLQVRVRDAERATRLAVGELNTQLSETVGGAETIRAFNREDAFVVRFRRALHRTLVAQESSVRYNAFFTPVTALLSSMAIALLLFVGARGAFGSTGVNLGTLVAFVLLFQAFFAPIVALGDQWNAVQAASAGAERVFEVLDLPVERTPHSTRTEGGAGLAVNDVTFGYHPGQPVLRGVSLLVRPGERVAIVGRTGSGKSTLLALVVGSYEPDAGTVLLAGRHPRDFDEHERRQEVCIVPQSVQLFSGSLRENITLGEEGISDVAVSKTLTLVGLGTVVSAFPEGLDTELEGTGGGAGVALSAGQRQLVVLARALVTEPQVLLLDEATAAIDAHSDSAFRAALKQATWSKRCAVVMVAHRISTARDADRVVVMEAGRVVETGTPDELVAAGGRFAALAELDEAGWSWREPLDTYDA
jgi:ATP-binding cassette subfamily B protein